MAAQVYPFLEQNSRLFHLVESKYFTITMLIVIVSNTCVMIAETYDYYYQKYNFFFLLIEKVYLTIYIVECALKLWVYSWKYFRIVWNCFDLFIIVVSIIDLITQELISDRTQSSLQIDYNQQIQKQYERINHFLKFLRVLRVLRSFRALRVLRTIRFIQPIHTIINTCSKALPAMASITFIMIIITCISAIIARSLFGEICPTKFDNLVKTFFSLFNLLTLDDWYSVYQVCEERDYSSLQLAFCLIYIFIINFILLNLLMAVLVDSFQQTLDYDTDEQDQVDSEKNVQERRMKNLMQLAEEYCVEKGMKREKLEEDNAMKGDRRNFDKIEKLIEQYYMLMETLEFRMERHEQLTKLVQKSIKLTLIDPDNQKMNMKK